MHAQHNSLLRSIDPALFGRATNFERQYKAVLKTIPCVHFIPPPPPPPPSPPPPPETAKDDEEGESESVGDIELRTMVPPLSPSQVEMQELGEEENADEQGEDGGERIDDFNSEQVQVETYPSGVFVEEVSAWLYHHILYL